MNETGVPQIGLQSCSLNFPLSIPFFAESPGKSLAYKLGVSALCCGPRPTRRGTAVGAFSQGVLAMLFTAPLTNRLPRIRFLRQPTTGRNIDDQGREWDIQIIDKPTVSARPWGTTGDLQEYLMIVSPDVNPPNICPAPIVDQMRQVGAL